MTSFLDTAGGAYTATRERARIRQAKRHRTPILIGLASILAVLLGSLAARVTLTFAAVRRAALSLAGLGMVCWGAWTWNTVAGMVATGLSLLVIEALSSAGNGE